ncbi:hypothetical protein Lalb_Chr25g0279351 [Lupinus albus]|uniref:Uncharacterized protein n=1 Tax=Lupinus albus TaxID=3870 RepID=A0A6A4ND41_LUPAL|nr:hypothetical protein Lalb_Chr25g0279351 [Lupinus albus]
MKCQHMSLIYVTTTTNHPLFSISIPSHRSCPPLSAVLRPVTCRAATPPPHQTDPPPGNHSEHLQDLAASLSEIQDRVQIFFAVLFWMSLFFWYSAWDGRNRPNNGSRFRR